MPRSERDHLLGGGYAYAVKAKDAEIRLCPLDRKGDGSFPAPEAPVKTTNDPLMLRPLPPLYPSVVVRAESGVMPKRQCAH